MILEHAVLEIVPGKEAEFEGAFDAAQRIIGSMPGFCSLRLGRCLESPSRYVLLVEWERLEDHTEGFRLSPEYDNWSALLHHFYEPFPVVEHFHSIVRLEGDPSTAATSDAKAAGDAHTNDLLRTPSEAGFPIRHSPGR